MQIVKTKKKGGILNRNAFTLIELLAIIVILAIIAVITVPIILNIIENSRKGAATDSAYGYKDSVNKTYIAELQNHNKLKLNDTYTVTNGTLSGGDFGDEEITSLPVSVSGTIPSSGSLTYENNVLKSGYLVIGDYRVTFNSNGTVTTTKNTVASGNEQTSSGDGSQTPSNPYLTRFDGNYTYFAYGKYSEDPTVYDFDYDDYQEQSNNDECPSGYAYYEGDGYYSAGCYYINYGYCYTGDYNDATGKCEYTDYGYSANINNEWYEYLRNDGTTYEVCGVFSNGTVCMTSSYYNDNYSTTGNYGSDFEDCNDLDDTVVYDGTGSTCLKGYAKAKADEMLSKGASTCNLSYDFVGCSLPSNEYEYCYVNSYEDGVECNSCHVRSDGTYYCS